ncbi:MAG: lipoprotein [Gammaproteobacteria bacterium]|nr:lipoprotein [Gammaproteobacteria bacterium]
MKFCWAQYLLWLMIAVLGAGSMLSACGQKGALVKPVVAIEAADSAEHKKEQ